MCDEWSHKIKESISENKDLLAPVVLNKALPRIPRRKSQHSKVDVKEGFCSFLKLNSEVCRKAQAPYSGRTTLNLEQLIIASLTRLCLFLKHRPLPTRSRYECKISDPQAEQLIFLKQ